MPRRRGRPGLVGTMARTAVIAGTASTVSGNVNRRQASRAQQDADQRAQQQPMAPQAPPPPAPGGDPTLDQLTKLADMRSQGLIDDAEFTAAKAKLLGL